MSLPSRCNDVSWFKHFRDDTYTFTVGGWAQFGISYDEIEARARQTVLWPFVMDKAWERGAEAVLTDRLGPFLLLATRGHE